MHRVIHRDWGWAKTHPIRLAALVAAFNSIAQSTVAAPQSLNDPLLDRPIGTWRLFNEALVLLADTLARRARPLSVDRNTASVGR
jgi:hypothetical protein